MSHGTEHHLEEAEHARHASLSPFDRRVAVTMAMVAAVLACVAMLSHRAHNRTLQGLIRSNDELTEKSNQYGYYQAKKNRGYMYGGLAELLAELKGDGAGGSRAAKWEEKAKQYEADAEKIQEEAKKHTEDAEREKREAERAHRRADFFDFGELGMQLSLVVCSLAVLTKWRPFWYAGIVVGVAGLAYALCGFLVG
jgi:hypothetical protein